MKPALVRCEDCRYWDNSTQHGDAQPDTTGLCRQSSPTAHILTGLAVWPFTEDTDGCGYGVAPPPARTKEADA